MLFYHFLLYALPLALARLLPRGQSRSRLHSNTQAKIWLRYYKEVLQRDTREEAATLNLQGLQVCKNCSYNILFTNFLITFTLLT